MLAYGQLSIKDREELAGDICHSQNFRPNTTLSHTRANLLQTSSRSITFECSHLPSSSLGQCTRPLLHYHMTEEGCEDWVVCLVRLQGPIGPNPAGAQPETSHSMSLTCTTGSETWFVLVCKLDGTSIDKFVRQAVMVVAVCCWCLPMSFAVTEPQGGFLVLLPCLCHLSPMRPVAASTH